MGMRLVGFAPASSAASQRGQGAAPLLCGVSLLSIAVQWISGTELVAPAVGSSSAGGVQGGSMSAVPMQRRGEASRDEFHAALPSSVLPAGAGGAV